MPWPSRPVGLVGCFLVDPADEDVRSAVLEDVFQSPDSGPAGRVSAAGVFGPDQAEFGGHFGVVDGWIGGGIGGSIGGQDGDQR